MTLYLLPNLLGQVDDPSLFLPRSVEEALLKIDGLIAESEGEGRRFLKRFKTKKKPHEMPITLFKDSPNDFNFLLEPILKGETWGVVSDSGLPCIADPGAKLVRRARQLNIPIEAISGPSSITLALMQSGLSGQRFTFRGYIAKEGEKRKKELKAWEKVSKEELSTQIFIEAPYRNEHTLQSCLESLHDATYFCLAVNLTMPNQGIFSLSISHWKKLDLNEIKKCIHKNPAIFLFGG